MAHQHLVANGRLPEGAAEGFVVEQRVISESTRSARRFQYAAFHRASKCSDQVAALDQSNDADESRLPVSNAVQPLQQERVVVGIGRFALYM